MSLFTALRKLIQIELTKGEDVVFSFPQNEKGKVVVKKRIIRKEKDLILPGKGRIRPMPTMSTRKGGEKMKENTQIDQCRELMDKVLNLLREQQQLAGATLRGRELAIAVTHMEEGCMRMIRSEHADKPYSPLLRLKEHKPAEETPAKVQQEWPKAQQASVDSAPAEPATPESPADQPAQQAGTVSQENQAVNNQTTAPAEPAAPVEPAQSI